MAKATQKSLEFNQRIAIIESLRARRTPPEVMRFFGYPKQNIYRVAQKFSTSEQSRECFYDPTRNKYSRGRALRTSNI